MMAIAASTLLVIGIILVALEILDGSFFIFMPTGLAIVALAAITRIFSIETLEVQAYLATALIVISIVKFIIFNRWRDKVDGDINDIGKDI